MKIGVQHSIGDPLHVPAVLHPRSVTRFARAVEAVGFDAIGFTDHPAPSTRWIDSGGEGVCDPFSALGFCAAVTERIRLLTWVIVAGYRNPLLLAQQLATLDVLSDGRVVAGLGTGYLKAEFHAVGADPNRRLELFDECVPVLRAAWRGDELGVDTATFSARGTQVRPRPVQGAALPIWVHGNSRFGTERAVRVGDGWIGMMMRADRTRTTRTRPIETLDEMARRIAETRSACEQAGRDPSSLDVIVTGVWPWVDVRDGLDLGRMRDDVDAVRSMGADWFLFNVTGRDPGAAEDTIRAVADAVQP